MSEQMRLHAVTIVVDDYDAAIAHYVGDLGFTLVEDSDLGSGKRWVMVSPGSGAALLLAKATTPEQQAAIEQVVKHGYLARNGGRMRIGHIDCAGAEFDALRRFSQSRHKNHAGRNILGLVGHMLADIGL